MGQKETKEKLNLTPEDLKELKADTQFSEAEIKALFKGFKRVRC